MQQPQETKNKPTPMEQAMKIKAARPGLPWQSEDPAWQPVGQGGGSRGIPWWLQPSCRDGGASAEELILQKALGSL